MNSISTSMRSVGAALVAAAALAAPVLAQQRDNQERQLECSDRNHSRHGWSCEVKEFPLGALRALAVDATPNGGISVKGANRNDILVRARIEASADTDAEAKSIASQVRVNTGGTVRADGPRSSGRDEWWSVTYEIFVPWQTDLDVKTHNGGVRIMDVKGAIKFDATNGGVTLDRLAGNVHGQTTNGGLKIELGGNHWDGQEMDVETTNGGVTLAVPGDYSAQIHAGTVNGGMHVDFPVTVQGDIKRDLSLTLGSGGAPIKVATTNGGVRIVKRS